ncbi:MAG: hypothetical protein EB127_07995 [Alphaproteobacteria bacterium]|jgi:hypothetical protein|nr:hypothetical protein [Alphaproteobacteria bacterium]
MPKRTRKVRKNKRLRRRRYTRKGGGGERTYVFLIAYRALKPQERRREELIECLSSIEAYCKKHHKKYAIYIAEENNVYPFNRGILLNAAFLESEKKYTFPRLYIHINCDYTFDMTKEFPKELDDFDGNGFLDLYNHSHSRYPGTTVGGASCFGADVFKKVNGFPNKMHGWGFEDNVLKSRAKKAGVPMLSDVMDILIKKNLIISRNSSNLDRNMSQLHVNKHVHNTFNTHNDDGLNTCKYFNDGPGEFDNADKHITHTLFNWGK